MNWYNIVETSTDEHEINILGDIGTGETTAQAFIDEVNNLKPKSLVLNISSLGGSVNDALIIYDHLRSFKGRVKANLTGMTASSATIVAMGADEIEMSENGLMLVHNVWTPWASGNADELEKHAKELRQIDDILVNIYAKKTRKRKDTILKLMGEERWLNVEDAKQYGFIDKSTKSAKNYLTDVVLNSIKTKGLPELPINLLSQQKNKAMDLEKLSEKIENLINKVEGIFSKKETEPISKDETLEVVNKGIAEIKDLYEWQLKELRDTINTRDEQIVELKNEQEKQVEKLTSENERLSGNSTVTIADTEVELEKVDADVSPFDGYAEILKNK